MTTTVNDNNPLVRTSTTGVFVNASTNLVQVQVIGTTAEYGDPQIGIHV
jgi:hypothetical protein